MLSERQLRELLKVFDERYQAIVEEYLQRMGEHLWDIGRLTDTDVHRLKQLKRMNANVEAIKKKIAKAAAASVEDVEQVFRHIAESNLDFANTMFAETHSPGVKVSPIKTLSSPMERILKAQLRITAQTMANLSQTTILSDGYKAAVDVAVQTVQSGLTDYNSAIRRALKEASAEGLRVQYQSGHTRRLDTAVRQNVLDGMRALNQDTLDQLGKEFGADGVEISAHMLCATDHLPYQGLQFGKKQFERIQNTLERPFGMWNCKHTMYPILLGISQPSHTKEELEMYRNYSQEAVTIDDVTMSRYEWSQQQRRIETAVREQKYIAVGAKASGDDVARREAQRNINRLQTQYAKISDAAGLTPEKERMAVAGFRKVKTAEELKNPAKYGIIVSGALDGTSKEADRHARQYYNAVRKMKTDCLRISENVGWKQSAIERVKNHIFFDEHVIYGEKSRFDPSYYMAQSWQRLIQGGKHVREQEHVLLKHEYLEAILEAKGMPHEKAHSIAQAKHNYAKYVK